MERKKKTKVAVGLSGGVDSSVAAALLKEEGYEVVGIAMEIFDGSVALKEARGHACYGPEEKEDMDMAASVCRRLGIPFHIIDLKAEYQEHVINYFRSEYLLGRTPNPCIVCNQRLKFGFLLEKARQTGIDFELFATGHYARIVKSEDRFLLQKSIDLSKDQTYFLYTLTPGQLSSTLFPIGAYHKKRIREIAVSLGLETALRPESQDFIVGGDYAALFASDETREGDIVDEDGNILGKHTGIVHYTVGQRRGLGISSPQPLYVNKIDAPKNRVVVSKKEALFADGLIATDLNLLAVERLDRPCQVKAKIRLGHKEVDATVSSYKDNKAKVIFNKPQLSVSPGQSVVLYTDDMVLGGGIIERAI